jgi:hypothetical protein
MQTLQYYFTDRYVPETKGKTLRQVQQLLAEKVAGL